MAAAEAEVEAANTNAKQAAENLAALRAAKAAAAIMQALPPVPSAPAPIVSESPSASFASPVSASAPFVASTWDTTPDAEDDDYRDLSGDAITTRESINMNLYLDAGAPKIRPQCNLATARNLFRKEGLTKEFLAHHQVGRNPEGDTHFPDWQRILQYACRPGEVVKWFNPRGMQRDPSLLNAARLLAVFDEQMTHVVAFVRDEHDEKDLNFYLYDNDSVARQKGSGRRLSAGSLWGWRATRFYAVMEQDSDLHTKACKAFPDRVQEPGSIVAGRRALRQQPDAAATPAADHHSDGSSSEKEDEEEEYGSALSGLSEDSSEDEEDEAAGEEDDYVGQDEDAELYDGIDPNSGRPGGLQGLRIRDRERRKQRRHTLKDQQVARVAIIPAVPKWQAAAKDLKFECHPVPTRYGADEISQLKLDIKAANEADGKRAIFSSHGQYARYVHRTTRQVKKTLDPADNASDYQWISGRNKTDRVTAICPFLDCPYNLDFRFGARSNRFECKSHQVHTCESQPPSGAREHAHAFEAPDLASVFLSDVQTQGPKPLASATMIQKLRPYLKKDPTPDFARKVWNAAVVVSQNQGRTAHGRAAGGSNVPKIKYADAAHLELQRHGFTTELVVKSGDYMKEVLLRLAQEAHERFQASLPGAQRQGFQISEEIQERLDRIDEKGPTARFVYGSKVVFPWAEHFVRKYMAVNILNQKKFFIVAGLDAAHCSGPGRGCIFLLAMLDANRNTVALAWAHFSDNENNATWSEFLAFVKQHIPALDDDNVTAMRDGAKAISNGLKESFSTVRPFYCVRHAAEAAAARLGSTGSVAAKYTELALALTEPRRDYVLANSTPTRLKDMLNRADNHGIPTDERLLSTFASKGGRMDATLSVRSATSDVAVLGPRHTNSFIEGNMAAAKADGSRRAAPVQNLLQTAITWTKRMQMHAVLAEQCSSSTPPQVERMLKNLREHADEVQRTRCTITPNGDQARVWPRTDLGNMNVICTLSTRTCTCGQPGLTGFPCICMAIFCKAKGPHIKLESLVAEQDTTAFWKSTYQYDFNECMISTALVWGGAPSHDLEMPAALPAPAGRPRTTRYKGRLERAAGRRPDGADAAPRKAQTCRKCGMLRKGHVCPGGGGAGPSGQ